MRTESSSAPSLHRLATHYLTRYTSRMAGSGAILDAQLDARTSLGRRYKSDLLELAAHVGTPSVVQSKLIDTAVRLGLIQDIAWGELMQKGAVTNGTPSPALEAFLKISKQRKDVLLVLGLERQVKPLSLNDYLVRAEPE